MKHFHVCTVLQCHHMLSVLRKRQKIRNLPWIERFHCWTEEKTVFIGTSTKTRGEFSSWRQKPWRRRCCLSDDGKQKRLGLIITVTTEAAHCCLWLCPLHLLLLLLRDTIGILFRLYYPETCCLRDKLSFTECALDKTAWRCVHLHHVEASPLQTSKHHHDMMMSWWCLYGQWNYYKLNVYAAQNLYLRS